MFHNLFRHRDDEVYDAQPSSIYSWSLSHILEHEFFDRLGSQGSKEKKVDLSFSEQLLRVFFSTFCGQNF